MELKAKVTFCVSSLGDTRETEQLHKRIKKWMRLKDNFEKLMSMDEGSAPYISNNWHLTQINFLFDFSFRYWQS